MRIRAAKLEDYPEVAEIHRGSFLQADTTQFRKELLQTLTPEFFEKRWQNRATDNNFYTLVAEQEGKILGFITTEKINNPQRPESQLLRFLYVHQDYLRQQIGTKLALAIAEKLIKKGNKTVHWYALNSDLRANSFYEKTGANIVKTEKKWLPLGSTPETFPDGTEATLNHYAVNDLKLALDLFKEKNTSALKSSHFFSRNTLKKVEDIKITQSILTANMK